MLYLFSDAGRAALRGFVDRTALFAFDLDGTLAPIVADPSRIKLSQEVRRGLIRLSRMASVAIITGRARADARAHLGFNPPFLVGNHGAEGLSGGDHREHDFVRLCHAWEDQLHELLPNGRNSGIVVENKGATLSIHYRNAPDRDMARRKIIGAVHRLAPLPRLGSGKFVENLVPQDAPNKGEALDLIMQHSGCPRALFVGDDETDEDVFRLRNGNIFGIRVGMNSESAAGNFIREQKEILPLLDEIIRLLDKSLEKDSS